MRRSTRRSRQQLRSSINIAYQKGKYSDVSKNELEIYALNDGDLNNQMRVPLQKQLLKQWNNGTYNIELAVKGWENFANLAAKKYNKYQVFSPSERRAAAISMERVYRDQLKIENPKAANFNTLS